MVFYAHLLQKVLESPTIVVMADEAHRGQYGFTEKVVYSENDQGKREAWVTARCLCLINGRRENKYNN